MQGEFVIPGWHIGGVYVYKADGSGGSGCVSPDDPDFPAAVAALQSLIIRPSLDPRSGRVLAMREGEEKPIRWTWGGWEYDYRDGVVTRYSAAGGGLVDKESAAAFEAGRRYERERG